MIAYVYDTIKYFTRNWQNAFIMYTFHIVLFIEDAIKIKFIMVLKLPAGLLWINWGDKIFI